MNDNVPEPDEKKSLAAKLLRPKVAIPLLILFLILIAPFLVRGWFLRGVPNAPEPFDAAPLLAYTIPDNENAFNDYRLAKSLYIQPSQDDSDLRDQILDAGWQPANDDIRQFLHDNEDALLAWKTGSEKDEALYIPAKDYHIAVLLDVVQELRELHRTAMLLCRKLEAEGKPQEAWEWYRAAIRASRHSGRHGGFIERLVGVAMFQQAVSQLETWAADPNLSADDLRTAVEQLQSDWQLTEQTSSMLQIEYLTLKKTFEQSGTDVISELGIESTYVSPNMMYFVGEPELSLRVTRVYFQNQLAFCDRPRYERPNVVGILDVYDDPRGFDLGGGRSWNAAEFDAAFERATLAQLLLPSTSQVHRALDREQARYRTLLVTLAGQAFRRDHGRFPNTLDELVPDYLDEIPLDNYDGLPLRYRFDPAGPVVYSVFENESDDGGIEWSMDQRSAKKSFPDDYGSQMRVPEAKPLTAPRP